MPAGIWAIHCDGSAAPNPGRMGLGAVLIAPDGVTRHTLSEATTATGCNNEAELRALQQALRWLLSNHAVPAAFGLRVYSDSSVLVEQLTPRVAGADAPAIARLAALVEQVRGELCRFAAVELVWIPRHRNREADALARAALGLPAKPEQVGGRQRVKGAKHKKPPRLTPDGAAPA